MEWFIKTEFSYMVYISLMTVSFIKFRTLLLQYLPEECVFKIEQYYVSIYYYESLSRINMMEPSLYEEKSSINDYYMFKYALVLHSKTLNYYRNPIAYLRVITIQSKDTRTNKNCFRAICRYVMYNMDYLVKYVSPIGIERYKYSLKLMLIRNAPCWSMCAYYYEQIFFKKLVIVPQNIITDHETGSASTVWN